jgi:CRP-like cAMP-binding protein
MSSSNSRNLLISQLSDHDLADLLPLLEPVELPRDFVLFHYNQPIEYYYFIEDGIGSMVAVSPDGRKVEAGLVGREGLAPVAAAFGTRSMRLECMMQVAGHGQRIDSDDLTALLVTARGVHALLLRFAHAQLIQTSYTNLSNATHRVDKRLARWILMCHDRVDGDEIALTHDFIAMMLGVRRSSVTETLPILEGHQLIRSERGLVIVRNRADLQRFAGDAYGIPEAEYEQLMEARLTKRALPLPRQAPDTHIGE